MVLQVKSIEELGLGSGMSLNAGDPWRICHSLEEWEQIHERGVDLLIWERDVCETLLGVLDEVVWDELPKERFVTTATDEASEALAQRLEGLALSEAARRLWLGDMEMLRSRFAEVMGEPPIRIRLDKLANNGCPRFHSDNITVRLLCTYIGPTTEWLSSADLRRRNGQTDLFEEESIQRIPRLSVALFKGRKHPTHEGRIYHRSPRIAGTGLRRFVFCLDDFNAC